MIFVVDGNDDNFAIVSHKKYYFAPFLSDHALIDCVEKESEKDKINLLFSVCLFLIIL